MAAIKESLELCRELGNIEGYANVLSELGYVLHRSGDYARAAVCYGDCLRRQLVLKDRRTTAWCLEGLAAIMTTQAPRLRGDWCQNRDENAPTGTLHPPVADLRIVAEQPPSHGWFIRAARLLGAADALREAVGTPRPPVLQGEQDAILAMVRTALDSATFGSAWGAGRSMALEQAIAAALEYLPE